MRGSKSSNKADLRQLIRSMSDNNLLEIKVTPNAAQNLIVLPDDDHPTGPLQVRVTVTPEGGKANAAVIKLLAKALGIPKSSLSIARGHKSKAKFIRLDP